MKRISRRKLLRQASFAGAAVATASVPAIDRGDLKAGQEPEAKPKAATGDSLSGN
jgi:hypothetical protein